MNHGIEVVLPVGHACGTNALLPPMLWISSVENSCRAPVFATAAIQSLLSSTTSGALGRSASTGRESTPRRIASIASRLSSTPAMRASMALVFPLSISEATWVFLVKYRNAGQLAERRDQASAGASRRRRDGDVLGG